MPSIGPGGVRIHGEPVVLAASAARTSTGSGPVSSTRDDDTARLTLAVTAAAGTSPTLTVAVQTSEDASTWSTVASFAQKTGAGTERKVFTGLDRWVRAQWTVGGTTPSFTFSVRGELT